MFMDSPGHRANILGKAWDHIGVGAYKGPTGKKMWTVLFADKCGSSTPAPKPTAKPKPKPPTADSPTDPEPTAEPTPRPPPRRPPKPAHRDRRPSRRPNRPRTRPRALDDGRPHPRTSSDAGASRRRLEPIDQRHAQPDSR